MAYLGERKIQESMALRLAETERFEIPDGHLRLTESFFSIEGEGSASDDFTNLALTNVPDGAIFFLRAVNASHVITIKHASGGDGQFNTTDGNDLVLDTTTRVVIGKRTGLVAEILGLMNFATGAAVARRVVAKTGSFAITAADCGTVFTNEGAGGDLTGTLLAAAAGLWFEFVTVAAHKVKVLTVGDDVIADQGGTDSAAPGFIQSSAAKGNSLRIVAINSTRWAVCSRGGTWTIDS
jgi:hypothetical protein